MCNSFLGNYLAYDWTLAAMAVSKKKKKNMN